MSLSIRNRALAGVLPWILPVVLLLAWQTGAQLGWITARVLPAPTDVVAAGWRLTVSGELWFHLKSSFERAAVGFVIGGGIGLALGFATGLSRWLSLLLDSTLQMVRNIPHLALIPLVILWFGIDETAKIFLVALGSVFPIS